MLQKQKVEVKVFPMEDRYVNDVLAVYNKIRRNKAELARPGRATIDKDVLTYEEIVSTGLGSRMDLSFIARIDDKVVGFVWGRLAYVGIPVQLVGFIHMIIVDPDLQLSGIATDLVDNVAKRCKEKGVDTIRTAVAESDWEMSNFFHEVGFENSGLLIYTRTVLD